MTEKSKDLSPAVPPTMKSNLQAAEIARSTERRRVLDILATAATPVDAGLLAAIEDGTTAASIRANQSRGSGDSTARSNARSGASGWGEITARFNARRAAARDAEAASDA